MNLFDGQWFRVRSGEELFFLEGGLRDGPTVLLLHGFPSSSQTFRHVLPGLARVAHVIAPDLPGFGWSEVVRQPSFAAYADVVCDLLDHLDVQRRFIYLHDFGAAVGLRVAMRSPDLVSGLIIQNANAHPTGLGPPWESTRRYWEAPDEANEAAATAHLTHKGTRQQYVAGVPADITAAIQGQPWDADREVMMLPGRLLAQRMLIADYAHHVAQFDRIAEYFASRQPPALLVWGRHDAFFDLAEVSSWMQSLPRMEAHVLDAGHFLLETHAGPALELIAGFVSSTPVKSTVAES